LRQLLRNLFNLRIAADLLIGGVDVDELRGIRSAVELLDQWWRVRVEGAPAPGLHVELVFDIVDDMVRRRALRVPAPPLGTADRGRAFGFLRSGAVLDDIGDGSVAFSHPALFDYAAGRRLFRVGVDDLVGRLTRDADLALFALPSFRMELARLWAADRVVFWRLALALYRLDGMGEVARVPVPIVVAESFREVDDLSPLLAALNHDDGDGGPPWGSSATWSPSLAATFPTCR
jgi:hypothetical protein